MKKNVCKILLTLCFSIGILRIIDLYFFSEKSTGFVMGVSVWWRYGLIALIVAFIFVVTKVFVAEKPVEIRLHSRPLFIASAVASFGCGAMGLPYAVSEFAMPTTLFGHEQSGAAMITVALFARLLMSVSFFVLGAWCLMLANLKQPITVQKTAISYVGIGSSLAFVIVSILRYAENPASVDRIVRVLYLCSALVATIFVVSLVGLFWEQLTKERYKAFMASAITMFFMGTCIVLPQTIWSIAQQNITPIEILININMIILGLIGANVALKLSVDS